MKISEENLKRLIKDKGMTIESFAKKIGMTRQGLYYTLLRNDANQELIRKMCTVLSVDKSEFTIKESKENDVTRETTGNIIYVPLYAYGGFLGGYRNIVFIDQLEHFRLPGVIGEHYAFEIGGFSMMKPGDERSATPGDIAISRIVEDFKHLLKGKGYILQTVDGILYKIFEKMVGEKAYFISLNEEYEGHEIPLKDIKGLYFVDFILKKQTNS